MSKHFQNLSKDYLTRLRTRFHSKYNRTSGDNSCWIWTGATNPDGYGTIGVGKSKGMGAHRVSYFLEHGFIPDGMHVLHKCDVRNCVRPSHLFLGTHEDNVQDMHRKGRNVSGGRKGSQNSQSQLTEEVVKTMRLRHSRGESMASLGREFEVSKVVARNAILGNTWKHVT